MFVNEIFQSLQGECLTQGAPTIFVRFAGCNLVCSYCDTSYAQTHEEAEQMSVSTIVEAVRALDATPRYVCLTGGEPLLQPREELQLLLEQLIIEIRSIKVISIETNGSRDVSWVETLRTRLHSSYNTRIDLVMDFKLQTSGVSEHMIRRNFTRLLPTDVIKFVCNDINDVQQAMNFLEGLNRGSTPSKAVVFFHSTGGISSRWLADTVLDPSNFLHRAYDIRFGVQLHKLLWGNERGR